MINTEEMFSRQSWMFNSLTLMTRRIVILWCWFVWSNLAYNLMKTWFNNFLLVDFDIVEEWNLLNQMYTIDSLWLKKTVALKNRLLWDSPLDFIEIETFENIENVLNWNILQDNDIVILSADNLDIRLQTMNYLLKQNLEWKLDNLIFCSIWTWSDSIHISMLKWHIRKLWALIDYYWDTTIEQTEWICWYKSAYYLWSLISWLTIWELRNRYLKSWWSVESWFIALIEPLEIYQERDCTFWPNSEPLFQE